MTVGKGWGLPESHLLPDAVVAFVDQELSLGAQERAAAHLAHCPRCSAEVSAQRAAASAVRQADTPSISAGFLASLKDIPQTAELPSAPDNLAVGADGQIVSVQHTDRVAGLRDGLPQGALGTSAPLGASPNVLGTGARLGWARRRTTQGAGVVVSGLVLSALALVATTSAGASSSADADADSTATPRTDVLPARFGGGGGGGDNAYATRAEADSAHSGSVATNSSAQPTTSNTSNTSTTSTAPETSAASSTSPSVSSTTPVASSTAGTGVAGSAMPTPGEGISPATTGAVMAPTGGPR